MTNEDKDKKNYELALLLKTEEDLAGILALAKQHNAELLSEPRAKKLALAYEIKGFTDAVFAYANVSMYASDAKELELDLRTRQEVLRFMVIISPPQTDRPSSTAAGADFAAKRRGRPTTSYSGSSSSSSDSKPSAPRPLSNEALEKKIEEILQ